MQLELKTASMQDIGMYGIYFSKQPANKKDNLPYGIALFQHGELQGERQIENSQPIPFQASWKPNSLPEAPVVCRVTFDNDADMIYELAIAKTTFFIGYLIDVVVLYKNKKVIDFPQEFYFELFRISNKSALKQP
jgi:hypothetical protein